MHEKLHYYNIEPGPEVTALHCGTNGLRWTLTSKVIASEVVALGTPVNTEKVALAISDIIARKDRWKNKASFTNESLKILCDSKYIPFVDYSNKYVRVHILMEIYT